MQGIIKHAQTEILKLILYFIVDLTVATFLIITLLIFSAYFAYHY